MTFIVAPAVAHTQGLDCRYCPASFGRHHRSEGVKRETLQSMTRQQRLCMGSYGAESAELPRPALPAGERTIACRAVVGAADQRWAAIGDPCAGLVWVDGARPCRRVVRSARLDAHRHQSITLKPTFADSSQAISSPPDICATLARESFEVCVPWWIFITGHPGEGQFGAPAWPAFPQNHSPFNR
jgi:hypothetical protein